MKRQGYTRILRGGPSSFTRISRGGNGPTSFRRILRGGPASFTRISRGGQGPTSFSRILRSGNGLDNGDEVDKKSYSRILRSRGYSRINKRGGMDEDDDYYTGEDPGADDQEYFYKRGNSFARVL